MSDLVEQKLLNLLGLAQRAGKIISGELPVEKAIRAGKVKLILLAQDSSDGTKKSFSDMAQFYNITLHYVLSKQTLGRCIGKDYRAVIALNDTGFIKHLLNLINVDDEK